MEDVVVSEEFKVKEEKWRGRFKVKPTGRPVETPDWRLRRLLEPSLKYIEGVSLGLLLEPNATRIALAWKIIERYGNVRGVGKKERVSGIEESLK